MGSHITADGKFQSDKYPTCPPGKVPLSVTDPSAQDLLWAYAQRRRAIDAEFTDDLESVLKAAGYEHAPRIAAMEAVLLAANEVIGDTEGPQTPAQARLVLAMHAFDPHRFALGLKEICSCPAEQKAECDECLDNDQALAAVRRMAEQDGVVMPPSIRQKRTPEEGAALALALLDGMADLWFAQSGFDKVGYPEPVMRAIKQAHVEGLYAGRCSTVDGVAITTIVRLADAADTLAAQAGVGGVETAGAVVSYLAANPDKFAIYANEGLFALMDGAPDGARGFHSNGCLTWHGQNGKIVSPEEMRAKLAAKATEPDKAG